MTIRVNLLLHLSAIISKHKKYDRCDIWNGLKIKITHTGTLTFSSHIPPKMNSLTKLVDISHDTVLAKDMLVTALARYTSILTSILFHHFIHLHMNIE